MSDDIARRRGPLSVTPPTEGRTAGEESLAGPTETTGSTGPRYRISGLVGIGGMGVVYRAEDTLLGRAVALKFLPPTLTPNPRAKARFLNEARAASALDHPNICTIYEVGETAEGQLYLAMAYYEGETLKQRLERGPLPVAEALHIALQVVRGLAKAHRHGIVHRDIKPANLMITVDGIVKILDFGIARLPDQTLGPLLGTPGYMSPEQARAGAVDARSDVWSLGVVLREMLTGSRPGHGGPPEAPAGEEPPVPLLPQEALPGIEDLLSHMLAAEPADRYPDAAALLADLSKLERAAAGPEGTPAAGFARRRRPAWAIILVAVLAIAAGSWLLWGVRRHDEAGPGPGQATLNRLDRLTDLPGKEWFPSITPDGNLLVYARKEGDRSRLYLKRVGGGTTVDLLPNSFEGDSQPAVSPDGSQIAFRSERDGGGIFVMGLTGESVRRVTGFGFNPAWSPDGKDILCATDRIDDPLIRKGHPSQIYRVNLATNQRWLVHKGDAVQPSWSPHGFRIAYWETSRSGKRVIWTIPAGGGQAVRVTAGTNVDWNPVWSPDGHYLYFASDRSGITSLWRVPMDERSGSVLGEPEPVTTSGQASMLSFSRDGRRIVYASDETKTILEKVGFDPKSGAITSPAVAITQTSEMIPTFDTSRDGRWLVYQTMVPQEDLFVIHPDGTGQRRLTNDAYKDRLPRWSPDGTRIAFYSNRGSNRSDKYEVWTIRADGSQLKRETVIPDWPVYNPIWSPDGRWLACHLEENEALIDLTPRVAERRPRFLPPAGRGMGFSASSWSADGRWLAGALHPPNGQRLPGVVLYSLADRSYERLTDRGESVTWLSDSRHFLYRDRGSLLLLDTVSRTSRQVLTIPPGSDYNDFRLSPDDRVLYLARNTEQGDIWLLTLK
jgi:eukaryotic-like serine/threonine-protein kinase